MEQILDIFLPVVIAIFALLTFLCLIRALKGPEISDRVVCVNMIGTLVIMIIAVLTVFLGEDWLADIAAVYAMISFLAVVVLTKIYIGVYREKHSKEDQKS
ncbi:MAG: sodium:proton antiporter [Lachnospiraceae bacterium]|nr:sodium:proton antiporter [Lachnospiraceae bacterium]MBO7634139.1 sodium:proton antiporter [Lachnospiraceae bacterium]MBP5652707.1 sodium:proton antiporter [Lachnospiraceae bacterium]